MRSDWTYKSFGSVFRIQMGKTPPRHDSASWDKSKETGKKWVSIADITSNEGKCIFDTKEYISAAASNKIKVVPKGSLLMSFKLTIGKMAYAGDDLYTNEAIIAIPKNGKYDLRFLYYYLSSYPWGTLTEGAEKVKGKTLNKTSISKIQLPEISLSEQHRIVDFLDTQFEKVEALKINAEQQLQAAKDLFQAALKDLLTPKDGWKIIKIGDKFSSFSGGTPHKSHNEYYENATIPWLNSGEVCQKYITGTTNFISELGLKNSSAKYFPIDTVLVAMYGATAAQSGILKFEATSNQAVCGLLPNEYYLPEFVYYWFIYNKEKFASMAQGGAQPNLSQVKIKNMKIPFIPITQQKEIVARITEIDECVIKMKDNFTNALTLCNDLKQALLKSIFE